MPRVWGGGGGDEGSEHPAHTPARASRGAGSSGLGSEESRGDRESGRGELGPLSQHGCIQEGFKAGGCLKIK